MRLELDRIRLFVERALTAAGVPAVDAAVVAASLVDAEATGQTGHGLIRFPFVLQRLRDGLINASPDFEVVHDSAALAVLDANNGLGPVAGDKAMRIAADKSRAAGAGVCVVRGSNHLGAMGFYVAAAADEGLIALALTNTPPAMAPPGGVSAMLGTNPIACAFPTSDGPLVIDLATSQVARGRVLKAARAGERIPDGWALDADGRPTTDPAAAIAGSLVPLGGAKGFALALMVEALTGVLAAAAVGPEVGGTYVNNTTPSNVGHLFLAIDPEATGPGFDARMGALLTRLRSTRAGDSTEGVRLPGDRRRMQLVTHRAGGVDIADDLVGELERSAGINI